MQRSVCSGADIRNSEYLSVCLSVTHVSHAWTVHLISKYTW